jgi:hypothetical protein
MPEMDICPDCLEHCDWEDEDEEEVAKDQKIQNEIDEQIQNEIDEQIQNEIDEQMLREAEEKLHNQ